jgi:hypothetical protein
VAAVVAVLVLVTALLTVLVIGLLRSHADVLRALHELGVDPAKDGRSTFARPASTPASVPPDDPSAPRPGTLPGAADIDGVTPDGATVHVAVTGVDHPTLLAFLTTGCELCLGFWEALADPAQRAQVGDDVRVVAVTQGSDADMPSAVARLAPADVTTVMSPEAWNAYNVPVAPFFAMVDGETGQVIGEGAAPSWPQLVDLLGRVVADGAGPRRGARARNQAAVRRWAEREADTDAALLAAGIEPGDPRLHHAPHDHDHDHDHDDATGQR